MERKKVKPVRPITEFMPNPFDPLGMYGATPVLPFADEAPTQDADDL